MMDIGTNDLSESSDVLESSAQRISDLKYDIKIRKELMLAGEDSRMDKFLKHKEECEREKDDHGDFSDSDDEQYGSDTFDGVNGITTEDMGTVYIYIYIYISEFN